MNAKKILPVLVLFILMVLPIGTVRAATFNLDGVGDVDSDEVFVTDFDIFSLPGEEEESPGGFINRVKTLGSSYWKSSGNYFLFIEWNRNYYIRGTWYEFNDCPEESLPYLCIRNNFGDKKFILTTRDGFLSPLVTSGVLTSHRYFDAEGPDVQLENGSFGECTSWELLTSSAFDVGYQYDVFNISGDFRIITNIPFFLDDAAIQAYKDTGDSSGAVNAVQIKDITEPEAGHIYDNNVLWLKMGNYDGGMLTRRPVNDAFCEWAFTPQATEGYTDLTLDVSFDLVTSFRINKLSHSLSMSGASSLPLAECLTSYGTRGIKVYPRGNLQNSVFGGLSGDLLSFFSYGVTDEILVSPVSLSVSDSISAEFFGVSIGNTDLIKSTGSIMTVKMKLKGRNNGDWVNGPAVVERVNLYTGECNELVAHADEDGKYTEDESTVKTTDKNGNVTINNNVSGGGGSGGGGSSSASGGNATATVGDITNTFKFPDKIDVNLNVRDIDIDLDVTQKKDFWENLLNAGNLVMGFLKTLMGTGDKVLNVANEVLDKIGDDVVGTTGSVLSGIGSIGSLVGYVITGFTLFSGENGLIGLYKDVLGVFPAEFWTLIFMGISVSIILMVISHFK